MARIAIIQDYLRSGGTERQSILLANDFADVGHEVMLLTFRPGGVLDNTVSKKVLRRILQPFNLGLDWFAPHLASVVGEFSPDIILCMGRMANCRAGGLQRAFPGVPVIGTMRTGKHLPLLFRRSLRVVRHIVSNSKNAANLLTEAYGIPAKKISVIYNSLVFAPEGTRDDEAIALRQKFGASSMTLVAVCVAMFRPEKNQRELVEIAAQLPKDREWQIWLAGDGTARPECEALVKAYYLEDRVKFVGFHKDPRPLYRAADLAVLTSRSDSLSNFLVEAHSHRLPSVAYDIVGISECGGIVVEAGNQPQFIEKLLPLLLDERVRSEASAKVHAYAVENFSRKSRVQAYLDLFESLKEK
ncbi:MAG: glycosyltransferase [Puniceicoccales bacterium]|jgi:glycosyltransferase involved in cell wall biosynthesis|nr:glycosyltransferase [Puniceicoccales bacterium]